VIGKFFGLGAVNVVETASENLMNNVRASPLSGGSVQRGNRVQMIVSEWTAIMLVPKLDGEEFCVKGAASHRPTFSSHQL